MITINAEVVNLTVYKTVLTDDVSPELELAIQKVVDQSAAVKAAATVVDLKVEDKP